MKNFRRLSILLVFLITLTGCSSKEVTTSNLQNSQMINSEGKEVISSGFSSGKNTDSYFDPYDLQKLIGVSDYVFIATVDDIGESYADEEYEGWVFTPVTITVNEVINGDVESGKQLEMIIPYGTVTIKEYEKYLHEGTKEKMGFNDLTEQEKETKYYSTYSDDLLIPIEGKQYLMIAERIPPQDYPFIGGANAFMLYEDGKAYNNKPQQEGEMLLFSENIIEKEYYTLDEIKTIVDEKN